MALTNKDRLRRVTLLCCHFTRNLAYYRAGRQGPRILPRQSEFWITVKGNFIDQCVLEWCKLFGDKNGQHYWGKIVADQVRFEAELFQSVNQVEFQKLLQKMREVPK
jgi:hypothetical protein